MTQSTDRELLARIDERTKDLRGYVEAIDERTKRLEKELLTGNGVPSIKDRLGAVERVCGSCALTPLKGKIFQGAIYLLIVAFLAVAATHIQTVMDAVFGK